MVEVLLRKRKPPILTPSRIPCLRQFPTINITQGCVLGCVYCYIQGYSNYPGPERVVLYENTAELIACELARKRRKPCRVYFSPSSDAFQPLPEVQDVSFRTMAVLLDSGVEVAFLTKGFVGHRFIRLFSETPHMIFAQVGITTLDETLCRLLEPRAAGPCERLEAIAKLNQIGVRTTARLDPLIPDVTDATDSIAPLLDALREAGVKSAAASYLFLRPRFTARMKSLLVSVSATPPGMDAWQYQKFSDGCGGGRMIGSAERHRRFARLRALGKAAGIQIAPCLCKNPGLGWVGCAIAGPPPSAEQDGLVQHMFGFAEPPPAGGMV
ncbi:MAG: radical SAM protein [Phycisphaerae bacterium]|nr:radical SAM protein [Phycisphaerae bacterium]